MSNMNSIFSGLQLHYWSVVGWSVIGGWWSVGWLVGGFKETRNEKWSCLKEQRAYLNCVDI